jgi:hypothetical protein
MNTLLLVFRILGQQALFWYFVNHMDNMDDVDIYVFFGYDINYL